MSESNANDVSAKLKLLRERFANKASDEFDALENIADSIGAGEADFPQLEQAYRTLHRLAGSAGTFGFPRLGDQAKKLELQVKPFVDDGTDISRAVSSLGGDFRQHLTDLRALLDIGGAEATGKATVSVESERKGDEPVVLVIEPDEQQGELLAKSLSLYGYESRLLREIGQWLDRPDIQPSIIVVRDEEFLAGSDKLAHTFPDLPVICLSATDSYAQRYALASAGAEAFYSEPLNLPLIADHLERLLTDHADAATGRVLIVDDDPELREHYLLVLASGGMEVCTVAGDPSRLMPLLYEFRPDIVLMDVQMGDVSGPALARMIRFEPEWLSLPVVYLSAEGDREVQLEALAKGGDDFLTKPVSDSFLLRTARRRCYRARQLDKLVSRDSLTGLLKHALAKAEVEKEHARCQRMKHVSAVAMLDLDHFKNVNDTQGHRAGDLVIKGLANLLRHRLRKTDIIGRYGGEEFLVALPDCDMDQAVSVLEAVCQDFSRIVFEGSSGKFSVTLSVGLSSLADYGYADSAVEAADQALYNRKRAGRNGVTVAPL